eukprot:TRINITY_DN22318_c0_g1_i2.p1 TRINITY_DN22318_c0_g1~~TRINITY_DN22318_c0_g1_i2.p1  ORF type:complete len:313 (-),score=13.23 TRINITY_DN22318_c0_g1_i2:340-1149(-)
MSGNSQLDLQHIREQLVRLEDTIIYALQERSQFLRNERIYIPNGFPLSPLGTDGQQCSLLEQMLRETEAVHAKFGRYKSSEENAFYPKHLPNEVISLSNYPEILTSNAKEININDDIIGMYIDFLLPGITQEGDDKNYGSAAICDIAILQALSRRIHLGKFVAEAKFQSEKQQYTELIGIQDKQGIMKLLTNLEVENQVVERVKLKAAFFYQNISNRTDKDLGQENSKQDNFRESPELVAQLYRMWVIPMTKRVEVMYLLQRLQCVQIV